MKKTLVPIGEAAIRCGVNKDTLWKWVRRGRIKCIRYPYGRRVYLEDVQARVDLMRERKSNDL